MSTSFIRNVPEEDIALSYLSVECDVVVGVVAVLAVIVAAVAAAAMAVVVAAAMVVALN